MEIKELIFLFKMGAKKSNELLISRKDLVLCQLTFLTSFKKSSEHSINECMVYSSVRN